MLRMAVERVNATGWRVAQVDVVVVTEQPKIGPHREAMRIELARTLGVKTGEISIKGKTNEKMGWIGRGEGLACMVVATITSDER
jgi:2-C-methyl-D-erythritol 2,4-cyclodiphosphate synthase